MVDKAALGLVGEPFPLDVERGKVFEFARPKTVVVTTPNVEYNVKFPTLAAGTFRHRDHRFEWTREQFRAWAQSVATRFDYDVKFEEIGPVDEQVGSPTQMAILSGCA